MFAPRVILCFGIGYFLGCSFTNEPDPGQRIHDPHVQNVDGGQFNSGDNRAMSGTGGARAADIVDSGVAPAPSDTGPSSATGGAGGAAHETGAGGRGGGTGGAGGAGGAAGGGGTDPNMDHGDMGVLPPSIDCAGLGFCGLNSGFCEPADEAQCQETPGSPVCYAPDHPTSLAHCEGRDDCGPLGNCDAAQRWCEPNDEPRCQAESGTPVCYDEVHEVSVRYCGDAAPPCGDLGQCNDDGGWCEPQDERRCQAEPGAPVCYAPDSPLSQMYCAAQNNRCSRDDQCENGWCRLGNQRLGSCVPWQVLDGRCEGMAPEGLRERCGPGLVCMDYPDARLEEPGFCRRICEDSDGCDRAQYCSFDRVCRADNTCRLDADCTAPGNLFLRNDCIGYGSCSAEQTCIWSCGDPRCQDASGIDFGDCERSLGVALIDGQCRQVTGCDGRDFNFFMVTAECINICGLGEDERMNDDRNPR